MPRVRLGIVVLWLWAMAAPWLSTAAQQADAPARPEAGAEAKPGDSKPDRGKAKPTRRPRRGGRRTYMGRPIADVMSYQGADWLVRPSREQEEQPDAMLDALKIESGSTVADVGAGVGYLSLRLAQRVGPEGVVLATDLQPQMLQMLATRARAAGVRNVRPIRATPTDCRLPEAKVDLVLMVDVYHEAIDPEVLLQGLRQALRPGGRLVLVEYRGEDPNVPIKPDHKMTVAQVRREVEPQGFAFKEAIEFLPWQHILIFERPAGKPGEAKETPPAKPDGDAAKPD